MGAKAGKKKPGGGRPRGKAPAVLIVFGAIFALLFIGFAVAQGIGGPSVPSGDVAVVSHVSDEFSNISKGEFDKAVARQVTEAKLKSAPAPGSTKYEELKKAAMTELVEQVWLQGEAEELGVSVTDKQIEEELANIKKQSFPTEAAYQKFLKESKFTQEEVNERVKLQLLGKQIQEAINTEAGQPSTAEIESYYEAEKSSQFTVKESRDIRLIINKDKKKVEEAKAELEKDHSPAGWKKTAPKFSSDPGTKEKGGLQEGITEELLQGAIKSAIFDSSKGELVGPVKFQENFILLEVVKLNPGKVKTLDEVKGQITETLTQENQQEHFSEFVTEYHSKWESRTTCASGYQVPPCSNAVSSGHPANASPACYEANPKKPATECPAPVTANSPVLPGSVTEQKPKGEPFPQRPYPESSGKPSAATEVPPGAAPTGE